MEYDPDKILRYQAKANTEKDTLKYQVDIQPSLIDFGTIAFAEQKNRKHYN